MKQILEMSKVKGAKFSCALMNPPFDEKSQLYAIFLNKSIQLCNYVACISPFSAFVSIKKQKLNTELNNNINLYKPELEVGNWEGFDAAPNSYSCVSYWDKLNIPEKINVCYNGKHTFCDKKEEIKISSNSYLDQFFNKLIEYLANPDVSSIYDIMVENPKNNNYFAKIGKEKIVYSLNKNCYYMYLPYIVAAHLTTYGYEKYNDETFFGPARVLVVFDNEEYAKNMYNTMCKKNGKRGELNPFFALIIKLDGLNYLYSDSKCRYHYMPMFDYKKSYNTKELFDMIGMEYNKEEIDKILNNK